MKNLFLVAMLGLLPAGPAAAQTAPQSPCQVFSGSVLAQGKPLSGVSVLVKGTAVLVITNEEGFFVLPPKVTAFPTLLLSAAGYGPESLTLSSCAPISIELQLLPGTRIKQHGRRKGFIMKTGQ